ncbi:hypothetical protein E4U53_000106 [Claviceps sorghi]|nr:hypothetical protein E4U53_000106 [Claviceps sorghi]
MKICIISLAKDPESRLESNHGVPDPSQFIPRFRHEFSHRQVTKPKARSDIDALCCEDFHAFMNCMGVHADGIEATKYLESTNATILTNRSSLLATSTLDLRDDDDGQTFRVPHNTYGRYPKMVKFMGDSGSPDLDPSSVCHNEQAVKGRIALLQEKNPQSGILIQDYIHGDDCAALVLDLGGHVIALPPIRFVFPESTSADAEFLTHVDKIGGHMAREVSPVIIQGELGERLRAAAANAFQDIKASHEGAFAHVKMRVERDTGVIYVIDVDCNPSIFSRKQGRFGGDFMLETTFPGKQEAFLDTLLTIKRSRLGSNTGRIAHTAAFYDGFSDTYDEFWESTNMANMQRFTAATFDFSGSVLDLACGTGVFGRILHDHGARTTEIVGVEISAGMLCAPDIKKYYKKPLWNCSMQDYVMVSFLHSRRLGRTVPTRTLYAVHAQLNTKIDPKLSRQRNVEFDHVVCFGALLFLDAVELNAVLARMFMMARKSLTVEVENLDHHVIEKMQNDEGPHFFIENHVQMVERFGIPAGWRVVHKQNGALYPSPTSEGNVEGYIVRFERIGSL